MSGGQRQAGRQQANRRRIESPRFANAQRTFQPPWPSGSQAWSTVPSLQQPPLLVERAAAQPTATPGTCTRIMARTKKKKPKHTQKMQTQHTHMRECECVVSDDTCGKPAQLRDTQPPNREHTHNPVERTNGNDAEWFCRLMILKSVMLMWPSACMRSSVSLHVCTQAQHP